MDKDFTLKLHADDAYLLLQVIRWGVDYGHLEVDDEDRIFDIRDDLLHYLAEQEK